MNESSALLQVLRMFEKGLVIVIFLTVFFASFDYGCHRALRCVDTQGLPVMLVAGLLGLFASGWFSTRVSGMASGERRLVWNLAAAVVLLAYWTLAR